ncbi:MAG: plasmid replication/partition related protein, partial [Pseudomonadota bacterium]|nr:plasmid replication/partition related protein [Pseudomonadota bacterium]
PDEYEALERSLLAEGCRDALVLWGNVLVDGHNRYGICRKHELPFQTVQNTRFRSMEDVHLWMIDQHLGRRSLSDFQRGVLALRKREIVAERRRHPAPEAAPASAAVDATVEAAADAPPPLPDPIDTREALARAAKLSSSQVGMIERIQKQATPELVAAVKSGAVSLSAAAAVASLPAEEQIAAASGGADELKQAAKRVREAKRKPREDATAPEAAPSGTTDAGEPTDPAALIASLRQRIAELMAENASLREQLAAQQAGGPPF